MSKLMKLLERIIQSILDADVPISAIAIGTYSHRPKGAGENQ